MSIEVSIYCDGCGVLGVAKRRPWAAKKGYHIKPHMLLVALTAEGWRCSLRGGIDLCADCVAEGKESAG